jgi:transcription factor SFP1
MPFVDWLSHLTSNAAIPDSDSIVTFIDADEGTLRDLDSDTSSTESLQPPTPQDHNNDIDRFTMPTTSPIDIATPTRNASSSPSSQGKKVPNFHDTDSRTSAMMSTGFDSSMGRGRQDSFGGAKPISMNNPNRNADGRPRRESLAGSLVGGMSWGGVSVGSWIRDEYVYHFIPD